jgi:hypothetical protein
LLRYGGQLVLRNLWLWVASVLWSGLWRGKETPWRGTGDARDMWAWKACVVCWIG